MRGLASTQPVNGRQQVTEDDVRGLLVEGLAAQVRGRLIQPSDGDYEEARKVYNGMHDRRPAVVVRCVDAGDVMATVNFAREQGGDLSVRGGSHSAPGFGSNDGGIVIDLSPMKGIRVDPKARTVRAESSQEVFDRIVPYREILMARDVFVGPQCGLELIPRDAAFEKLLQARYLKERLEREWRWRS